MSKKTVKEIRQELIEQIVTLKAYMQEAEYMYEVYPPEEDDEEDPRLAETVSTLVKLGYKPTQAKRALVAGLNETYRNEVAALRTAI